MTPWRWWILPMMMLACGGADPAVDCATSDAFVSCEADGAQPGVCLDGACVVLEACAGEGCAVDAFFAVGDSGLDACMGPSGEGEDGTIACPGTAGDDACAGTPYCGQDAQYDGDLAFAEGRFSTAEVDGEATVTDAATGLTWQRCLAGQHTAANCAGEAMRGSWDEAAQYCRDSEWGGFDDWVLPSAAAVHSMVDFGTTSPAINAQILVDPPSRFEDDYDEWWKECLWSGTESATDANVAWALMVNSGDVLLGSGTDYHPHDKGAVGWEGCYAACVRAPTLPTHERFLAWSVDGEAVVADTVGQRIWQACSVGQTGADCAGEATPMPWLDALAACEGSTWAGYDDWRLPDIVELRSLVHTPASRPAIDSRFFPNTPYYRGDDNNEGQFWSSTARWYNSFALYVSFNEGGSHFYVQDERRHVRCVRGARPAID